MIHNIQDRLPSYRKVEAYQKELKMKDLIRGVSITVLLIALTHLAMPSGVYGQDGENIKFSHITVEDGLSHHEVSFILQDAQGFMWFGTKYGLNKYDGIEMKAFTHDPENSNSLCGDFVWWIEEAKDGSLWVPTWGSGISRLDPKTGLFTNYHHDENDPQSIGGDLVWSVYEDRKGRIWAAPDSGGLNKFNPETDTWFRYRHDPNDPKSLSHDSVSVMSEDNQGMLWVATYGGGLNKFDPEKETFTRYQHDKDNPDSLSDNNLWYVYIDSHAQIWVGSEKGLNKFDPETEIFVSYQHDENDPGSLSFNTVTSINEDQKGHLWVGTFGGGLNRFDPEREIFVRYQHDPRNPYSILNNTVTSIYEDATGTLWVSSYGGVDKYDPGGNRFEYYYKNSDNPDSLSNNTVRSIYQDRSGSIWIGTEGGGMNRLDKARNAFVHYTHDDSDPASVSSNDILAISADSRDNLWIGTNGAGLNKFNPTQGGFVRYRHDPVDSNTVGSDTIYDLAVDRKRDILWIAAYMAGLDKFDIAKQTFVHYSHDKTNPNSLNSNWVTALFVDSKGNVWIGAEPGLSQFDPVTEIFTNFKHDRNDFTSLSSDLVYTVFEDSRGVIWIGTNSGLNRYDASMQTFARYYERDGLAGNRVVAIEEEDRDHLWISTDNGLSRFNTRKNTFRNYDRRDGLQGNRFSANASYKNATGELFFGGTNGFNIFHPDELTDNPHIPRVVFTDFQLFNQPVRVGEDSPLKQHINQSQQISLEHDQTVFSIEFVALNYRNPRKNQYAYMMEGLDRGFTYTDSDDRSVTYTHLDPGRYSFRVKASNNDGVWNKEGKSIEIIIRPPWWKTIWFKALIGVIIFLIILCVAIYVIKLRSEIKKRKRSEEALWTSEKKYKDLQDASINGHAWTDMEGHLIEVNDSYKNMMGYSEDELRKLTYKDITPEKWHASEQIILTEQILDRGYSDPYEKELIRKDGTVFPVELSAYLIKDAQGNNKGMRAIVTDITKRKQAEDQIKSSLSEKEVLLREIHHRVKNNMQVITTLLMFQSDKIKDKRYADMFKESQDRIRSMALVHEKLYQAQSFAQIDFKEYVNSLVNSLFRSYGAKPDIIALQIDVEDVSLELESAIPCGLIINELVSNALKYAFPEEREGEIRIVLYSINTGELVLEVSDNGIGMPEELDIRNTESIGLHLVTILSEDQLEGRIELNKIDGTNFRIRFKKHAYKERI